MRNPFSLSLRSGQNHFEWARAHTHTQNTLHASHNRRIEYTEKMLQLFWPANCISHIQYSHYARLLHWWPHSAQMNWTPFASRSNLLSAACVLQHWRIFAGCPFGRFVRRIRRHSLKNCPQLKYSLVVRHFVEHAIQSNFASMPSHAMPCQAVPMPLPCAYTPLHMFAVSIIYASLCHVYIKHFVVKVYTLHGTG